jgi:quinoprotein dehydrogenase-associated probable ABC transporter substrate-binding protein
LTVVAAAIAAATMIFANWRSVEQPSVDTVNLSAAATFTPAGRELTPLTPITAAVPALPPRHDPRELWVCADPNNMPFSNSKEQGFENQIAKLLADELGRQLRYFWEPQRRGFVRTTLKAGNCDVVIGVPAAYELVEATHPYYQSTYVFVARRSRGLRLHSFDDPRLSKLTIGIQITGEDYENPPAAHALASRHLQENVRGFPVYGDYSRAAPQRTVIDAVAAGRVDTAVVWGPLAGYFASRSGVPLDITPVTPSVDRTGLPFVFEISMGVRRGAIAFRAQLDDVIERRQADFRSILRHFAVPLIEDDDHTSAIAMVRAAPSS